MFDTPSNNPNTTGWLIYNASAPKPVAQIIQSFYDWDDTELVPIVPLPAITADTIITAFVNFTDINGINYAIINNNSYKSPNVPAMFTALTTGKFASDVSVYGATTNSFVLNHLDMIWLVINNEDTGG